MAGSRTNKFSAHATFGRDHTEPGDEQPAPVAVLTRATVSAAGATSSPPPLHPPTRGDCPASHRFPPHQQATACLSGRKYWEKRGCDDGEERGARRRVKTAPARACSETRRGSPGPLVRAKRTPHGLRGVDYKSTGLQGRRLRRTCPTLLSG